MLPEALTPMNSVFLMLAIVTFASAAVLTALARRWAPALGYVDHPGERKIHRVPTPYGGGVAIFLSLFIAIAVAAVASWLYGGKVPPSAEGAPGGAGFTELWAALAGGESQLRLILGCATFLFLLGVVDDRWGLSAPVKLFGQLVVAFYLWRQGVTITAFLSWRPASFVLTVLWVVGLTNAFNFLDNMNGLAGGLACVSGAIFFTVAVQTEQVFVAAMLAMIVGAVAGFLLFNYPRASIFLGDAGSLLLGFLLATLAIKFQFYSYSAASISHSGIFPIVLPLLIFAIPIYDITSVVILRLRAGQSPLQADQRHFSHRLVTLGMSQTLAVFTILLLAFALGITATLLYLLNARGAVVMLTQAGAILGVIVLLEVSAARRG
jgi:UDP-GlcNAc:undecaprenyl-phosphate GlcNAc-1-phosphate transferase